MTVALSAFYPLISLACPSAPNPLIDDAVRRSAREFCRRTLAVTEDITVAMVSSTKDYSPTLTASTEIIEALRVKRPASATLTTPEFLAPQRQEYVDALTTGTGKPSMFCTLETFPRSLRMYPTPTAAENLTATFALMPTTTAVVFDDRLGSWYFDGVVAYAKYYLQSVAGQSWYDPEAAVLSYRQFEARVGETKVRRSQGIVEMDTSVQMRPFA